MTRVPTLPLDDRRMWRKAIAALHPDRGEDYEACIWIQAVRDTVCSGQTDRAIPKHEPQTVYEEGRVPFPEIADFEALTRRALEVGEEMGGIFAVPLGQLYNCRPMPHLVQEQERGVSYKRLAYLAHICGMSKAERIEWYRVAESIPLSDRHAGHIIAAAKRPGVA